MENGHTLHLVERQPTQQHAASDTSTGDRPANGMPNRILGLRIYIHVGYSPLS